MKKNKMKITKAKLKEIIKEEIEAFEKNDQIIFGHRVSDALFYPDSGINRGTGTIIEIEEMEGPPRGAYSVIVKWDKPIPEGNPTGLTEDTSDDYLDDLILLENEE